jgi:MarR family 2-MHQ and catechol resistance regulon transcriptional repressor
VAISEMLVLENGWLTERQAHDLAAWYAENSYVKDPLAIEANSMAIRAGNVILEAGRPEDARMTVARFSALRDLYRAHDQRMSMTEISRSLSVTMTNVTKLIEGLVGLGLVERIEDGEDKRKTWAHLTPEGAKVMKEILPKTAHQVEQTWSVLTPHEKRQLIHLLAKVKLQIHLASGSDKLPPMEGIDD